ncbi:hypothetical protein Nepgr_029192 [Nepenthes gracilis]|uniref:Major facilitator superfamily (MFS) profile domain-containing protein n=1 Tax=Nepenthes gracilis TaxID=150966 RepID=A0AAD3TE77_NEPGR|nr:hypothetical protein Nepgr_029192 [Nepenthes gracilis]
MEGLSRGLSHLFMTMFLYEFSASMVIPAITDVTMSALCPGQDECSLAIYLTGIQQATIGLGTLVVMPMLGNLSDVYGRKVFITVPMCLSIIPSGILAYKRTTKFFYAYYVLRTLIAMFCEGSVQCLSLAYVADNVAGSRRAGVFGMLTGIGSCAFVCGNIAARFLSTPSTFQVSAAVAVLAMLYMRIFLPESVVPENVALRSKLMGTEDLTADSSREKQFFKGIPSLDDMASLLRTSSIFSQAAVVAFFDNFGEVGLQTSLLYYLKARFHFNKDQFADLMVIAGIAGTASQLLLMPMLVHVVGEEKLLSIGLFFGCAHVFLYSIAWSSWVPYAAAMLIIVTVFSQPCLRSIISQQVGPSEQGKAQGCISGICSFAKVISPLAFSPLTALFLSKEAPFHFPGFGIMCAGLASMIALIQSIMIRQALPPSNQASNYITVVA